MRNRMRMVRLNNGVKMPVVGFGTYSDDNDGEITQLAVRQALKMGYRHFDTAKIYGSEPALGKALTEAIADGVIQRKDVFVTSKLWSSDHHDPVSALKQTLDELGLDYIDMYLVHWPVKLKPGVNNPVPEESDFDDLDMENTWYWMEQCLAMGLCRCIGVSNFSTSKLQQLLCFATVPPAVNQVEMHPMWRQRKLREFCRRHRIHVSAYSPLGGPGNYWGSTAVVGHPVVKSIALKHDATPAQVALARGMSRGVSVIVKSFNQRRMKENIGAIEVELDEYDMLEIQRMEEWKIMRGEFLTNQTTSPYRTIQDLWDDEI
ncbi:OLC1v1027170C1 [Oldenlandia corymbosa var. corymbosa]|uniref:OLC1v1027170C1 n=1 Tax=Oldenlandia corymbosa var. corymbosa TaxID=529605 RepID=A0AAV1CAN8_OLDCO|nr:OLC1v1027170C1 [Oldenlandia corymbosa var. corymbosa]